MIHILRHEIRLIMREPRFWIPFVLPPFFLVGIQAYWLWAQAGLPLDAGMFLITGALLATMSATLTADSFAGERERNTLELLLCLPLSPRSLFWGKLSAILPLPLCLACLAQMALWLLSSGRYWMQLGQAWTYSFALCLVATALSLYVSLISPSVRSAAQINALVVLVLLFGTHLIAPWYFRQGWLACIWGVGMALGIFALLTFLAERRFRSLKNDGRL